MSSRDVLSYGIVDVANPDKSKFIFPDLLSVPEYCKDPGKCKVTCYSYRKNEDKETIRKDLRDKVLKLGYRTKEEFEIEYKEAKKHVDKLTFKNLINPFNKNKSRNEKLATVGLDAVYASPFILIPVSFIIDSGLLLGASIPTSASSFAFAEIFRRGDLSENKSKIKLLEKRFKDPNSGFFCSLKEIAPKIDVETVYVEDANKLIRDVRNFKFVDVNLKKDKTTSLSVNYNRVNQELIKIYEDFLKPKI